MTSKYVNSTPHSSQIQYTVPANVDHDFTMFVQQYTTQTVVNVENIPAENVDFFREAIASLYHNVYVAKTANTDTAYGSGNYQLVKIRRDESTFYVDLYGLRTPRVVYAVNDATIGFSGDSMKLTSNNGFTLTVKKSGDVHDFGDVKAELWQITLENHGSLVFRYQTVLLTL